MKDGRAGLPQIPDDLRQLMAEIGPKWRDGVARNVDLMVQRFSDVLKNSPRDGVTVHPGISYGDHERNALDVFLPEKMTTPPPVVLFVHGGAVAGINIGYRLANDAVYPEATNDIAAAVAWAREHAAEFGWDPARIFLMGHSAGAAHAGSYAYDPRFRPASGAKLAGMIVVSGRVRVDNSPENPNAQKVEIYYGPDSSKFDDYSPVAHIDRNSVPTFVAWAEFENPLIDVYCAELVYRLAFAKRKAPPSMWLAGHNHTSSIGQIGTSDDALGQAIVDFVRNPR